MKLTDIFEAGGEQTRDIQPDQDEGWDMPAYSDTADLPARLMPNLEEKIEKLNKRARKLGVPEITISVVGEKDVPVKDSNGEPDPYGKTVKWLTVKVEGEAPKLAGWQFVATIQHKEGGNVIRSVPGHEDPVALKKFYEARPDYCDHCHTRRRRIDTFIVKNDKGEYKQIGRNCIKDFLGGKDPKAILWYVSILDGLSGIVSDMSDDDEARGGGGGSRYYEVSTERALTAAATAVRLYGYRKASGNEHGDATSQLVRIAVFGSPATMRKDSQEYEWYKQLSQPSDEDKTKVQEILSWWATVPQQEKDDNTFLHNIDVIIKGSKVSTRDLGFAVGIFPVYARAMDQVKVKERGAPKANEYIGQPGDKIAPTKITVTRIRVTTSYYGYRPTQVQIVAMEDEAGNAYTWFNNSSMDMEEGQKATITGTVKKHEDFNGRKQTHLTRVKIVPDNAPVKPVKQPKEPKAIREPQPLAQASKAEQKAASPGAKTANLAREIQVFASENGRNPNRQEFIKLAGNVGMGAAYAATYWQKIKNTLTEPKPTTESFIRCVLECGINIEHTKGPSMSLLTELLRIQRLDDDDKDDDFDDDNFDDLEIDGADDEDFGLDDEDLDDDTEDSRYGDDDLDLDSDDEDFDLDDEDPDDEDLDDEDFDLDDESDDLDDSDYSEHHEDKPKLSLTDFIRQMNSSYDSAEDEEEDDPEHPREPEMGGEELPPEEGPQQPEGEGEDELAGLGDDQGMEEQPEEEPTDPNRAGLIRYVPGAHLVYKREQDDGTYEEMWIYNSGEFKKDIQTKKAILAGTDIPPNATQSPDGAQTVKMWSAGNADILQIVGLPQ